MKYFSTGHTEVCISKFTEKFSFGNLDKLSYENGYATLENVECDRVKSEIHLKVI